MAQSPHTVGFVYILTNESMPGIVKVGFTKFLPEDRATDLYTTGVPQPFQVVYRSATSHYKAVERKAHEYLQQHRVNEGREFFRLPVAEAIEAVRHAAVEAAGIASWRDSKMHCLCSADRLALSLEGGQMFAVLAFSSATASSAEPVDFWQAHSDGDLLEILSTPSATHVAGFSDGDSGSTEDTTPYLDRKKSVANGMINGRERLMPGDRLVWLPAPQSDQQQASVVFEAQDYCQVISRTWSPRLTPEGWPLLLNMPTHQNMWPEALESIRKVLTLPLPRFWAPRQNRDPSWEIIGSAPPPPEHWLPQLKPRRRSR